MLNIVASFSFFFFTEYMFHRTLGAGRKIHLSGSQPPTPHPFQLTAVCSYAYAKPKQGYAYLV